MAETGYYDSDLTGEELDAAFREIKNIGASVAAAAASAAQAQKYAESMDPENFVQKAKLIDLIYPVGSIYMSTANVSPKTFLGGTWQQIEDRFLLSAGRSYSAGSTGGAAEVTLQAANMPTMSGNLNSGFTVDWGNPNMPVLFKAGDAPVLADTGTVQGNQVGAYQNDRSVNIPGTNTPLSVMPPYLAVYMWKRIA